MRIEIVNWDKYNPRNDAKAWAWYRFQIDFFDDPELFDLSGPDLLTLVYLFCRRGKATTTIFDVNLKHAAAKARATATEVEQAIAEFSRRGLIKVHPDAVRERTDTYGSVRERADEYPTGRNVRDGTDETYGTDVIPAGCAHPLGTDQLYEPPQVAPAIPDKAAKKPTNGTLVWEAYRSAYQAQYGHPPARNAKVNSHCANLVNRLGLEAAVGVVGFFLTHRKKWYLEKCHMLDCCVSDAEALHTQWLSNHQVTSTDALRADKNQTNRQVFEKVAADMQAKYGGAQ